MVRMSAPFTSAVADVRAESVGRYLAEGWRPADGPGDSREPEGGHVCDACQFVARSAAGLGSHRRRHEGG